MLEPDPEHAVAYGLFSLRQARAAGFRAAEIRRRVDRGSWRRLGRGVLVEEGRGERPGDHLVLAVLRGGPGAVLGFETAAAVHGWDCADLQAPPRLILPLTSACRTGVRMQLHPGEVMLCGVVPVTTPVRTALDVACDLSFVDAVVFVDAAFRSRQVSAEALRMAFTASSRRGIRAGRVVLAESDPLSGSVPETQARLLFLRGGLLRPRSQQPVRLGDHTVRLDFGWEDVMLGVEVDGFAYHSAAGDYRNDRRRQNAVQLGGWLILRYTVGDIRHDSERVLGEVRAGLSRMPVVKRQKMRGEHRRTGA